MDESRQILAVCILAIAAIVVLDRMNSVADGGHVFDIGAEASVATWFTSLQFALAALAAAVLAARPSSHRPVWALAAVGLALFSIDEVAMLHESAESGSAESATEDVVLPALALGILVAAVRLTRGLPASQRTWLVAATGFLFAAMAIGGVENITAGETSTALANALSGLEEVTEMLVGSCALAAALPTALSELSGTIGADVERRHQAADRHRA